MTRSIGTFQRFKHDDVMRATHSVSVISHSLHDCIGPNRVRPPHTAVHLLRPPLVPPPTRPPSSTPSLPPPSSPPPPSLPPLPPTPSIEKRPVLYAPAHTLYLACVLNARDRCLSFCLTAGCACRGSLLLSLFSLSLSSNKINTVDFSLRFFFLCSYNYRRLL
ncbi:hypothetical protein ALC56_04586 [Trachymyrmex septentrionalis]|uniref:Uncharacterized protein n=1 Tax=Trachymyrmex septentrionalis TaxID=34720 RepID=A0A195FKP9_9HYME|nr:hypothetical protein ALC56_04586 [Trachymyrmex septentrionalis]